MTPTSELAQAAQQELLHILHEIEREDGRDMRHDVARALRSAVREGRICGDRYDDRNDISTDSDEDMVGCVIGQIAYVRSSLSQGTPRVPGWDHSGEHGISALERLVLPTSIGETPQTSDTLAALDSWLAGDCDAPLP